MLIVIIVFMVSLGFLSVHAMQPLIHSCAGTVPLVHSEGQHILLIIRSKLPVALAQGVSGRHLLCLACRL